MPPPRDGGDDESRARASLPVVRVVDGRALVYDADYLGNRCGVGSNAGKPKAFYPRIPRDMLEQRAVVESLEAAPDVVVAELNDRCALLTVVGPMSADILRNSGLMEVVELDVGSPRVFGFDGRPVVAAHTSEYAVLGVNLIVDEGVAGQVWATISRTTVAPCGSRASDAVLVPRAPESSRRKSQQDRLRSLVDGRRSKAPVPTRVVRTREGREAVGQGSRPTSEGIGLQC